MTQDPTHHGAPAPSELRKMFGRNLRTLSDGYRSVSDLCRQLGINRTQFNRYLAGESFPRPDVLHQICQFFDVDARILLEPLTAQNVPTGVLNHPFLHDYIGHGVQAISEDMFPSGFYRFSRQSFIEEDHVILGMIYVFREDGYTFVRGYEARRAMKAQGLPTNGPLREFHGVVTPQEDGISFTVAHRRNMASTYNYLSRVAAFQNSYWVGYAARPTRETKSGRRVTRLVYERLNGPFSEILAAARQTGYVTAADLPAFHQRHLLPDVPFT